MSQAADIIIGVIVTQRSSSLQRLLASLEPVENDPGVHIVILENSDGDERERVHAHARDFDARCAGDVRVVEAIPARLPLHAAREALTAALLSRAAALDTPPIVWMVDDDVTFQELVLKHGVLSLENVAREHISVVRSWREDTDASLVIGSFTGDPPIRPEAVLATQLGDLSYNLERMARVTPGTPWRPGISTSLFEGDYYYDHAEADGTHLSQTFPWARRAGFLEDAASQLEALCEACANVGRGSTPFRPMIASPDPASLILTDTPRRGGNTIFFDLDVLARHRYPAFLIGGCWSRRADMIGATIVAREPGVKAYESSLSLHHDRSDQRLINTNIARWVPEFGGVLLARCVMSDGAPNPSPSTRIEELALGRVERITSRIELASTRAANALGLARDPDAWWWHTSARTSARMRELEVHLEHISSVLEELDLIELRARLTAPSLLARVEESYAELMHSSRAGAHNAREAV